jgi:hypothetical protein
MMYAHFEDSDFGAYRQSMDYLVNLLDEVRHLCPAHNEAYVPTERLKQVALAFEQIAVGQIPYQVEDGIRVYRLEGFGITLPG